MSNSILDVLVDAVSRGRSPGQSKVDKTELEDQIIDVLLAGDLPERARLVLLDTLKLCGELELMSQLKGTEREKAFEVYKRLGLLNGKRRLQQLRAAMVCDLIASEMKRLDKRRLIAAIRDPIAHLLGMSGNPSGVTKIWSEGQADARRRVRSELPPAYVEDLKLSIEGITATIQRESK